MQVARRVERRLAATRPRRRPALDRRGADARRRKGAREADDARAGAGHARRTDRSGWRRRGAGPPERRAQGRIGAYLTHGEIGARMIRAAGGRPEIAAWAEVHQRPRSAIRTRDPAGRRRGPARIRCRLAGSAVLVAAVLAAAAAILSLQLFVPPVVGLADNGDYERVIGYAGFQHTTADPAERYFSFLRTKYAVVAPGWFRGGYLSSETLLAFAARGIHASFREARSSTCACSARSTPRCFLLALAGLVRACRDLALGDADRRRRPPRLRLHGRRLRRAVELLLQPDGLAPLPAPDGGRGGGGDPARPALGPLAPSSTSAARFSSSVRSPRRSWPARSSRSSACASRA